MKLIYKLLALFIFPLLTIPAMASTDNMTANDNSTQVVPVDSVTIPIDNTTVYDDVIIEQFEDEQERENEQMDNTLPTEQVFVRNDGNYLQALYPYDDIMQIAEGTGAVSNVTFEQELIAHDDEIPFDTYLVNTADGKNYTVVVVYTKGECYDDFGRAQLYFNQYKAAIVRPTPMAICKALNMQSLNSNWKLQTAVVKSYKIVNSHYGRLITDNDNETTDPEPIDEIEENVSEIINNIDDDNNAIAVVNNTGNNNTIVNTATSENNSITQENTSVDVSANVTNSTESLSIIGSNVNGDVNVSYIDKTINWIGNITNSVINLYINYT